MSLPAELERDVVARRGPSGLTRVFGLGSVFGKSLRDARWALLFVGLIVGGIMLLTAATFVAEWDTLEARRALAAEMALLPTFMQGMLGEPVGLETLPGFLSWRTISVMPVLLGLWPVLALSATIAGEASKGSLELLVATPVSRVRIAVEKAAAHVVALALAMLIASLLTWLAGALFARLPGDEVGLRAALSAYAWVAVVSLFGGAVAFALSPALGRGLAAGAGAAVLYGSFTVNGYSALVPGFDTLKAGSVFAWTAAHRPLAGQEDWLPVLVVGGLSIALLGVGVWSFARRDIGATIRIGDGGASRVLPAGISGPFARSFVDRLPTGLGWGLGFGLFGLVIASSAGEFARLIREVPGLLEILERIFPGRDIASAGGMLQLYFFSFGSLLLGLAAAALVSGWASDELERRLDLVLGSPLTRRRWATSSGLGTFASLAVLTLVVGGLVTLGAATQGDDVVAPLTGVVVLGLYGAALVGAGLAIGGLGWPRFAAPAIAGVALATFLLDLLGPFLGLPDVVLDLALVRHLGQPMLGDVGVGGVAASAVLGVTGLMLAAWGMGRRDLAS
jgi:ABC-2 type transport system permease protein